MLTHKQILRRISREANREPMKRLRKIRAEYKSVKEWVRNKPVK